MHNIVILLQFHWNLKLLLKLDVYDFMENRKLSHVRTWIVTSFKVSRNQNPRHCIKQSNSLDSNFSLFLEIRI